MNGPNEWNPSESSQKVFKNQSQNVLQCPSRISGVYELTMWRKCEPDNKLVRWLLMPFIYHITLIYVSELT